MNDTKNYTIKEVSELSGLPESTLRFYETIGIIDPIKRDPSSKHRSYSENEMNIVVAIACLNATGMSIEDMKSYLKNRTLGKRSARQQIDLLITQKNRLAEEAQKLKLRRQYVAIKIAYWEAVNSGDKDQVEKMTKSAREMTQKLKVIKQ